MEFNYNQLCHGMKNGNLGVHNISVEYNRPGPVILGGFAREYRVNDPCDMIIKVDGHTCYEHMLIDPFWTIQYIDYHSIDWEDKLFIEEHFKGTVYKQIMIKIIKAIL